MTELGKTRPHTYIMIIAFISTSVVHKKTDGLSFNCEEQNNYGNEDTLSRTTPASLCFAESWLVVGSGHPLYPGRSGVLLLV
ncbi:unnamed protein product [Clavelina lepadiformis]|uniref:Secreted protein n=1 Tax=Clavelina lepadiformis TaxID=159417 RepID=A0ABP0GEU6_CLALP